MKKLILLSTLVFAGVAQATPNDLYIYPAGGQDTATIERDRYECYVWASNESGFDPSEVEDVEPGYLVRVPVPENRHRDATGKGMLLGAIAGVALKDSHEGAAIGAALGAITGAIIESEGRREAKDIARQEADEIARYDAEIAGGQLDYRRAFTACLEGRGYVVR